jgi:acrylyl-CoA reductase (NADPH)
MEAARFAGCVDAVGGQTLGRVLGQLKYRSALTGRRQPRRRQLPGQRAPLPFARGERARDRFGLLPERAAPRRLGRLARDLPMDRLDAATQEAALSDLPRLAGDIHEGRVQGRVVIDLAR